MATTLPEDVSSLDLGHVLTARAETDARIGPLMRRWPALNAREMGELKRLWGERIRLASRLGFLRKRGLGPREEHFHSPPDAVVESKEVT